MKINLFCLPPAGSSASLYSSWNTLANNNINIIPIEYPGHGALVRQPLTHNPDELADLIVTKIKSHLDHPFMIFGHSIGAALIWRIENKIRQTPLKEQLKLLIISGRPESEFSSKMEPKRFLNRSGMINALKHYNAVPDELLQNEDAMDFFLNILRNDFHLNDNMLQDKISKTDTPLLVFYGKDDPDIPAPEQMLAWEKHSSQWLGCHPLPGGHFFFNDNSSLKTMIDKICLITSEL